RKKTQKGLRPSELEPEMKDQEKQRGMRVGLTPAVHIADSRQVHELDMKRFIGAQVPVAGRRDQNKEPDGRGRKTRLLAVSSQPSGEPTRDLARGVRGGCRSPGHS